MIQELEVTSVCWSSR